MTKQNPASKQASKQAKYDMTFVVPVYNAAQYLDECLQSIVASSAEIDVEILCINDGSTDNSLAVLQKWVEKHPEIRIISQENQGVSLARNRGIDEARGRYIWFVDSDDYLRSSLTSGLFSTLIARADEYAMDILRGVSAFNQGTESRAHMPVLEEVRKHYHEGKLFIKKAPVEQYLSNSLLLGFMPKTCFGFYRTEFLRTHGCRFPVGIANAEDEVFEQRLLTATPDVRLFEASLPVYFYRQHEQSASHAKSRQLEGAFAAADLMLARSEQLAQHYQHAEAQRTDAHRMLLWTARFLALRVIVSGFELFLELDEPEQTAALPLITPERLRHFEEFIYLTLTDKAGSHYNDWSSTGFGKLAAVQKRLL